VLAHCVAHAFEDDEWPFLPALVTTDNRAAYVILVFSHLAADGYAAGLAQETFERLLTAAPAADETACWQPLDQAAAESSTRAAMIAVRAAEYWHEALRQVPVRVLPVTRDADQTQWSLIQMRSRAMAGAVHTLAARHGTSSTGPVLAALSAVLAARTEASTVALRVVCSNRLTSRMRAMMCSCVQLGLFVVQFGDEGFASAIERTREAMLLAYRYAYAPPSAVNEVYDDLVRERGAEPALDYYFHSAMRRGTPAPPAQLRADELRAAARRTVVRRRAYWPQDRPVSVDSSESPGGMSLALIADPSVLSRDDAEATARGVEALLIRAVHEDVPLRAVPDLMARCRVGMR
jgi:hypothetical protein